jgi:hypothetical protein
VSRHLPTRSPLDRLGRLPKPPWYDRLGLMLLVWSLKRQPAWIARRPTVRKFYAWRADTGPIVLVTLAWSEPDGMTCSVDFRTDIVTMIKTLIEFTEKLPDHLPMTDRRSDASSTAADITRKDI